MSGPFCDTCGWFRQPLIMGNGVGECYDPSKIIYLHYGKRVNSEPEVLKDCYCRNWKEKEKE